MILNSNMAMAVTCEKCGKMNTEKLNLFVINKGKKLNLICSCGSLNCIISSSRYKNININININCIYCGKTHEFKYKSKEALRGMDILCPETAMPIVKIGNKLEIDDYVESTDKDTIEALYDESFETFFINHDVMKKSLEKLGILKENKNISCECGSGNGKIEIYSDRIELKCMECGGIKIIYAESEEDLNVLLNKAEISIKESNFDFIDAANNSDHK